MSNKKRKSSNPAFEVDPEFCFRTPVLPLSTFCQLGTDVDSVRVALAELLERPEVHEALYIASPELIEGLPLWREQPDSPRGRRIERSLVRYLSRMAGRATPFGAFAGTSIGKWSTETALQMKHPHRRKTRLDHDYLSALCSALNQDAALQRELTFSVNTSLYRSGQQIRYTEERSRGRARSHHLVSVEPSDALIAILGIASKGVTIDSLVERLGPVDGASRDEVVEFVAELIANQILVSDLTPALTGDESLEGLIDALRPLQAGRSTAEALARVASDLQKMDGDGLGLPAARYTAIAERLLPLPCEVEMKRLIQVDLSRPTPEASIHNRIAEEIMRGVGILHKLSRPTKNSALNRFRDDFVERYGTREVPLFEALDEESGIGFGSPLTAATDPSPLLAGIPLGGPSATPTIALGKAEQHLLRLYASAIAEGAREISLSPADVEALSVAGSAPLPPAIDSMATLVAKSSEAVDRGDYQVLMEAASGPSGMRLVGRFCHLGPEYEALVRRHLDREKALRPDAVFAEVVHLPEGRMGNILSRPVLRDYEIPYLGESGAPKDQQIPVGDLMLRVDDERLVLRSRRLNREVIPRLTNAHNYSEGLGVYRFLCGLQAQGHSGVEWSWGPLATAPHLPRVTCGKLIFSRATWNLQCDELATLAKASAGGKKATSEEAIRSLLARQCEAMAALRVERKLPRFVVFADDDLELPVDLDNPLSVESLLHALKSKSSAVLCELLPGPDALVPSAADGGYMHELVVTMTRVAQAKPARARPRGTERSQAPSEPQRQAPVVRHFPPGSSWLYAKLYASPTAIDELLRSVISPIVSEVAQQAGVERWFFIRYADPDHHVRLRFNGPPALLWGTLLPALSRALNPLVATGQVARFELATYDREVERYGGPAGLAICEDIFDADSEAVLGMIERLTEADAADARWRLALRGIDQLLEDLGMRLEQKLLIIGSSRESFGREFGVQLAAMKRLGQKYRDHKDEISELLSPQARNQDDHPLAPGFRLLDERSEVIKKAGAKLHSLAEGNALHGPLENLAGLLVHMHANRVFATSQRAQELVLYDLLTRHYKSIRARRGQGT